MDRQTLCDWSHHYNASGLPGLYDRREDRGAKPRLSVAQQEQVAEWVREGPDRAVEGVVRWRCVDLARRIGREFGVSLAERGGRPPMPRATRYHWAYIFGAVCRARDIGVVLVLPNVNAALLPQIEPGRECLEVPAPELPEKPRL